MKKTSLAIFTLLLFCQLAGAQSFTFKTLPHPKNAVQNSDEGVSINNNGTVLMNYLPIGSFYKTVKVFPTGYTQVKLPPYGISRSFSNTGQVGGTCFINGQTKGFLIRRSGLTILYSIPGKIIQESGAMNDFEHKVLGVRDLSDHFSGAWRDNAGHNKIIDYPGAQWTNANGLNNSDDVVGEWFDGTTNHGYLYSKGQFYSIDVPGASATSAACINNLGDIAGTFWDAGFNRHGFIYKNGAFITIDFPVPDGVERLWTNIAGMNDKGAVVGSYLIVNPATVSGFESFAFVATEVQ